MLQQNQQQFEQGKLNQEQKFAADQKAREMAATFANNLGLKQWELGGEVIPNVVRAVKGTSNDTPPAPSTEIAPVPGARNALTPLTKEQRARAAAEPNYAKFLQTKGYQSF